MQVLAEGCERAAMRTSRAPAVASTVGGEGALRGEFRGGGRVATDGDEPSPEMRDGSRKVLEQTLPEKR